MLNSQEVAKLLGINNGEARAIEAIIAHPDYLRDAAKALGIGVETVKSHLLNVRQKLGLTSSTSVVLVYDRVSRGATGCEAMQGLPLRRLP